MCTNSLTVFRCGHDSTSVKRCIRAKPPANPCGKRTTSAVAEKFNCLDCVLDDDDEASDDGKKVAEKVKKPGARVEEIDERLGQ